MKKIFQTIIAIVLISFSSCSDQLNTYPTDQVSGNLIFGSADASQIAMNGIYRLMYEPTNMFSASWASENPGINTLTLVKDLHGEDHLMANQGQGWFYYDYGFGVDGDFSTTSGRQYAMWKMNYTFISQANYIIEAEEELRGYGEEGLYVLAQAYATRAFAYTCLYEWFCKGNYATNSNQPGVPIYTEATSAETVGKPRGTIAEVFTQINSDFQKAINIFEESGIEKNDEPSHLDKYTAYGLWARVALIQEDWANAQKYANAALSKPGLTRVASLSQFQGMNDSSAPNVLWGFYVIPDQTGQYAYFMSHVDPEGGYGAPAQQCIDAWLYDQIPDSDERKLSWWDDPEDPEYYPYVQVKYRYADFSTFTGDNVYLRAEELILIAAEAACVLGEYSTARSLLSELGSKRDTQYTSRLASYTNEPGFNTNTRGAFTTLRDEILFQRRVELWCEGFGRAYDLRRLNLGYIRNYEGTNHTSGASLVAGDNRFVTLIPQREIDSNENMSIADQNPR